MIRRSVHLAAAAGAALLAWAGVHAAEKPGPSITPPPGFSVHEIAADGSYSVEYEVWSTSDDDVGCQVAFAPHKAPPGLTQDRINAQAGSSDYAAVARASIAHGFDVEDTEAFSMQGVTGFAMTGAPKGAAGQIRVLIFALQTLQGRTAIICGGPPARFDALRTTFETIAHGVTLPR